ncbi:hypothetical protein LTR72_002551 [Exophiala xenobiotica]|nr:hypothetical protein LTR72_002551 [Exophiala xenobiotica]KAK5301894.1 hypothetical protein LTR14_000141 [Exophiala xenobiotica]KAK5405361.1 hypothetical protein LTR06_009058 [Exophiala xenobiotica]KAK5487724.1 hypothetical protein LTR55_005097 [Exophiala xenobiotica]
MARFAEALRSGSLDQDQTEDIDGFGQQDQVPDYGTDDADDRGLPFKVHDDFYAGFSLACTMDEYRSLLPTEGRVKDIVDSIHTFRIFKPQFDEEERFAIDAQGSEQLLSAVGPRSSVAADVDSRFPKALRQLYVKYLKARKLFDEGSVAQAWIALAALVREARLYGCKIILPKKQVFNSSQKLVEKDRHIDESEYRRRILWLLIDLDAQLTFLLGHESVTSCFRASVKPSLRPLKSEEKTLRENVQDFSSFALEIMEHINTNTADDETSSRLISRRLEDALRILQEHKTRLPPLQQENLTDSTLWTAIADHQFEVQLFEMALHCRMARLSLPEQSQDTPEVQDTSGKAGRPRLPRKVTPRDIPKDLLQSVRQVVDVFEYIYHLEPMNTASSWLRCFGLYCAAVILAISLLRGENDVQEDVSRVERALKIFHDFSTSSRPSIALLAVPTLTGLITEMKSDNRQTEDSGAEADSEFEDSERPVSNRPSTATPVEAGGQPVHLDAGETPSLKRPNPSSFQDQHRPKKRSRYDEMQTSFDSTRHGTLATWRARPAQAHQPYSQPMAAYGDMAAASFHEPQTQGSFEQHSFPTSAASSFNANDHPEYPNLDYPSAHPEDSQLSYLTWFHPPMWFHPPLWDKSWESPGVSFGIMSHDGTSDPYYGQHPMPITEAQRPEIRDGHHVGVHNPAPKPQGVLSMSDARIAHNHAGGTIRMKAEHVPMQHDGQFYEAGGKAFVHPHPEHPVSSPIMSDGFVHQADAFGHPHPDGSIRRRSVADIRQQQNTSWRPEGPPQPQYTETKFVADGGMHQPPTPPQESLRSPTHEADPRSRRNSATKSRQTSVQGYPGMPPDRPVMEPAQMAVHAASQMREADHYPHPHPPSRKQSTAGIHDVASMADSAGPSPQEQADQQGGQWHRHYPPPKHGPYLPQGPVVYPNLDGRMEQGMAYDQHQQQFQRHLQPNQVVSTGAYAPNAAGRRWWG